MNIAIITARGGSKRIPRKNIKDFLGKPIIAYSIEAALLSGVFDEVMVSTDDDEIAQIAEKYGAKVPFKRSVKNSDDYSTTAEVLLEVISQYEDIGVAIDYACCIYPTAPFVSSLKLSQAFDVLISKKLDTVFPICPFSYPILRSLKIDEEGLIKMNWPEFLNSRSQDLPKAYHDAGQFYFFDVNKFIIQKKLFTDNAGSIIVEETEVQDIDNEVDWKMAEMKYKLMQHGI
jgi:pseudaminic acid cytidylyltransferase